MMRRLLFLVLLLLPLAAGLGQAPPATAPSAAPLAAPESPGLGERVNAFIDDVAALGDRLLELPLFLLILGLAIPAVIVGLLIARYSRRRPRLLRPLIGAEAFLLLLFLAILADRRMARLQDELRDLRARATAAALAQAAAPQGAPSSPALLPPVPSASAPASRPALAATRPLLDLEAAARALEPLFHPVSLNAQPAGPAVTFVQVQCETPLVKAYVSIVDLRHPGVQVKINADLTTKTLTSAFAKEQGCAVAINGEAGSSPAMGAPLGPWRGHLVRAGEVLLTEVADNPRPFLSFSRDGRPRFISAAATDRAVPSDGYNVIWGRWDVLVDSTLPPSDFTRQPRTAMALSADRARLYLFVGDGRQPRNSIGFTRAEVGNILRALGASDGMLCDEGGSSCMYLASIDRIVNTPADRGGRERPVYTHFGVIVK